MKATWILTALVLGAVPAAAQQAPPVAMPAAPAQASENAAIQQRRDDIRMMESILTNAVRAGANNLAAQLQVREPGSLFVTEMARARGFSLDGYGVFFDVDVPGMKQSVLWSAREVMMQQMRTEIAQLQALRAGTTDPNERRALDAQLEALGIRASGSAATPARPVSQENVATAQSVDTPGAATVPTGAPLPPDPANANELYTEAVKASLEDAMLKHIFTPRLGDEEWLTVAARDATGPSLPGQLDESSTIVLRIKGSDLTEFQSGRITREEVLKRIEIREF